MKFILSKKFELRTTKTDFERKFKANVINEKIHYFTPPLLRNEVLKEYSGIINEDHFRLKKNTSFKHNLNFEVCYGKVIESKENIELEIEVNGIQGFSIFLVSTSILVGLLILWNLIQSENYNQNGALYIIIPILGIYYYLLYKKIIMRIRKDVANTAENIENDIRNWLRI